MLIMKLQAVIFDRVRKNGVIFGTCEFYGNYYNVFLKDDKWIRFDGSELSYDSVKILGGILSLEGIGKHIGRNIEHEKSLLYLKLNTNFYDKYIERCCK